MTRKELLTEAIQNGANLEQLKAIQEEHDMYVKNQFHFEGVYDCDNIEKLSKEESQRLKDFHRSILDKYDCVKYYDSENLSDALRLIKGKLEYYRLMNSYDCPIDYDGIKDILSKYIHD